MTVYRFTPSPSGAGSVSKGLSSAGADLQKELQELRKGQQTLGGRISYAPEMIKQGRVNPALAELEKIVTEGEGKPSGFFGSLFNNPIVKNVLAPVGAVLGTAQRAVVSTIQEGGELITGAGDASIGDWFNQIKDPTYGVGTLMREHNISTGNKKLDAIIAMAGDIVTDPLTYITFGSTAFAGRAGRIALATKAAEAGSLAKAPSLANKLDDIIRYGEFALDDVERAALGVQKGLRVRFGDRLIKGTGGIAQKTGRGWSEIRSIVGDIPSVAKGLSYVRPKSYAGGLTYAGRGVMSSAELIPELATRSANLAAKGAGRVFGTKMADELKDIITDVSNSPYRATVFELVESPDLALAGVRAGGEVISDSEKALAKRIEDFFARARVQANEAINEYSTRTGMNAVPVNNIQDYFHHTLTNESRSFLARVSKGAEKKVIQDTEKFLQQLDLTYEEFTRGAPAMRARKLTAGEDFLGEPLKTGTIKEINERSMEKLGFKFFEEDAVTVMNSYINSMAKTVSRNSYAERLLDFGTGTAKALTKQLIADPQVVAAIEKPLAQIAKAKRVLISSIGKQAGEVKPLLGKAERGLAGVVSQRVRSAALTGPQVETVRGAYQLAKQQLDELRTVVATKSKEVQDAFETVAGPIEKEINQGLSAIDNGQATQLAELKFLQDEYVKTFPNAKKIPDDVEKLSGRVATETRRQARNKKLELDAQIKDLQGQIDNLPVVAGVEGEQRLALETNKAVLEEQRNRLDKVIEAQEKAPYSDDGFIYINIDDLQEPRFLQVANVSSDPFTADSIALGQVAAFPAPSRNQLFDFNDPQDVFDFTEAIARTLDDIIDFPPTRGAKTVGSSVDIVDDLMQGGVVPEFIWQDPMLGDEFGDILRGLAGMLDASGNISATERAFEDFIVATQNWADVITKEMNNAVNMGDNATVDILADALQRVGISVRQVPDGTMFEQATNSAGDIISRSLTYNSGRADDMLGFTFDSLEAGSKESPELFILEKNFDPSDPNAMLQTSVLQGAVPVTQDPLVSSVSLSGVKGAQQSIDAQIGAIEKEIAGGVDQARLAELQKELATLRSSKGGVMGSSTRKQARVAESAEQYKKAGTVKLESVDPKTGKTVVKEVPLEQARKEVASKELALNKGRNKVNRELGKLSSTEMPVTGGAKPVSLQTQEKVVERLQLLLNKVEPLAASDDAWINYVKPYYDRDIEDLLNYIDMKPKGKDATSQALARWAEGARVKLESIKGAGVPDDVRTKLDKVVTQLLADEADLAYLEFAHGALTESLTKAQAGVIGGQLREMADKGWTALYGSGVQVPNEVRDLIFNNVAKLNNAAELSKFLKAYQKYHQFFKAYAILTPGFIVRNSMSSAFMNFVAGVPSQTQIDAVAAAFNYVRKGPSKWLDGLAPKVRAEYEEAWRIASATGAGQTVDDMIAPAIFGGKGSRILNNKALRAGAKGNEAAELSARFAMALDGVRKGLPFDSNIQRINRFHFDYTDLSKVDEVMRQIVPFWIWTSRNIPLQIANMWTRPSVYSTYEQIKKNAPVDSDIILPKWLKNAGPIGLTGGTVLIPDFPQTRLEDNIRQIIEPRRLAGQLNPLLKLPLELTGNVQYSTNIPFSEEPVEAKGLDVLAAILGAPLGMTSINAQGKMMIDPRLQYAFGDLLPPVARVQRLIPQTGGKSTYGDRRASSLASFFGIPIRQVPLSEQRGEVLRRQRLLQEYATRLQQGGFIPPVNG